MFDLPDPTAEVAKRLRSLHSACGHPSYADLGRLANMAKTTVSDKINGKTFPSLTQFMRLVDAICKLAVEDLGCDPAEIRDWYLAKNQEQAEIRSLLAKASRAQRRADSYSSERSQAVVQAVSLDGTVARRSLGTLVRELRIRAGMTQEQLSLESSLGLRTIRRLETGGISDARLSTVRMIAEALARPLGFRPDELRKMLVGDAGDHRDLTPTERQIMASLAG